MKNLLLSFLLAIPVLCAVSCDSQIETKRDAECVQAVQIISFDERVANDYQYTVLREIEEKDDFVKRLEEVKVYKENDFTNLDLIRGTVFIRIEYPNGDYDLISPSVQIQEREEKQSCRRVSYDEEEFNNLICAFLPEDRAYLVDLDRDSVCIKFEESEKWKDEEYALAKEFVIAELKKYTGETFFSDSEEDRADERLYRKWIVNLTGRVAFCSEDLVSIVFEGIVFSPGKNDEVLFSFNFDPKTGERLLFEDRYKIKKEIYDEVSKGIETENEAELKKVSSGYITFSLLDSLDSYEGFCQGLRAFLSNESVVNWYETENGVCFAAALKRVEGFMGRQDTIFRKVVVPHSHLEKTESDSLA